MKACSGYLTNMHTHTQKKQTDKNTVPKLYKIVVKHASAPIGIKYEAFTSLLKQKGYKMVLKTCRNS